MKKLRAIVFFVPCIILATLLFIAMVAAMGGEETDKFFRNFGR